MPPLVPVAQNLDISLVWFGVLLRVNLQASFMHPAFGFALFYLRGVAPKEVLAKDICWGAIPFLCLQLTLVATVIVWPESVPCWLDRGTGVDPATVRIEAPAAAPPTDDVPVFR